jgi:hypothetical protein
MNIPYNKGYTNILMGFNSFAWFNGKNKVIRQQVSKTVTYNLVIQRMMGNLQWEKWKQPQVKRTTNHDTN